MNSGWKLFIKPGIGQERIIDNVYKLVREFDYEFKVNYSEPREVYQRVVPGQVRRAVRKEAIRNKERSRIKEIVSGIFAKKQIKVPSASVYDIGWMHSKGKHEE